MYNPVENTTPQNPIQVATVGGEPGGRAPVVVVDDNAAADLDQHTSTLIGGQAEPGHDIFNQPKKNINSEDSAPRVEEEEAGGADFEPSRIVSVVKQPQQVSNHDDAQREEGTKTDADTDKGATVSTDQAQGTNEPKDSGKKNGPLGEAEAEAEKVAQELFPDAVGA